MRVDKVTVPQRAAFDGRAFAIMLVALLIGVAWAAYNFTSSAGLSADDRTRPLVWAIFATPFALFIGWVVARRNELARAAFTCFCLYFFTVFVAARIQSLLVTPEQADASGNIIYFIAVISLHLVAGLGLVLWRAFDRQSIEMSDYSKEQNA